jgi:hypothetical protein
MVNDTSIREALAACDGNVAETARLLGMPRSTLRCRLATLEVLGEKTTPVSNNGFSYPVLPSELMPVEDLLERRKLQFAQKRAFEEATKLVPVKVNMEGPIGILHFGDPHVDDDGTDVAALEAHTDLVRNTPGLFGANIGDTSNNWVGRLARLYGEQSTSCAEAWQLVEWFIGRCPWLYLIGGNHDQWSGAGDPIHWMQRQGSPYQPTAARLKLEFPNGNYIRINARHEFTGNSQWNSAHAIAKGLQMGAKDHLAIAGHKHISGYNIVKDAESGIACHALQIASYKVFDRYGKERGFRDQHLSPCALTVIDPAMDQKNPDLVKVFWTPEEGAEYLTYKRKKAGCND